MDAWQNEPFTLQVSAGDKIAFCTCGLSKTGPRCDGGHAGTGKVPQVVKFEEDRTIHACGCHKSSNRPYCDGSHAG